jgi:hypothetical protein
VVTYPAYRCFIHEFCNSLISGGELPASDSVGQDAKCGDAKSLFE